MATLHEYGSPAWHPGEDAIHRLLNGKTRQENPTYHGLARHYAYRVAESPLVAFGALDGEGWPCTTVWGGEKQFARPIAQSVLGVQSLVDLRYDPVVQALFEGKTGGELVRPVRDGGEGPVMAGLSIDLETRDRVKIMGRMVAGAVTEHGKGEDGEGEEEAGNDDDDNGVGELQLAMLVQGSLGNCPKYLNKKHITPHVPHPALVSDSLPLPQAALDLLAKADLFFLSTSDAEGKSMDTNHRGGPAGLIRVISNSAGDGGVSVIYPEFSGNRLYQTLGNMQVRPRVGLAVPDFETGDVLYLSGTTRILVGAESASYLPHTKLAVRIDVRAARLVRDGLPFRGDVIDYSPYNPPVRRLASEMEVAEPVVGAEEGGAVGNATLVGRQVVSPTAARFTFALHPRAGGPGVEPWRAGAHVTMDFSGSLDAGWSHMRDDDPQSLNDDYVRTFTISSAPPPPSSASADGSTSSPAAGSSVVADGTHFQITARLHGPVTGLLWRYPVAGSSASAGGAASAGRRLPPPLEVPIIGFAGPEDDFAIPIPRPDAAPQEEGQGQGEVQAQGEGEGQDPSTQDQNQNQNQGEEGQEQEDLDPIFVAGGVGITPLLAQLGAYLAAAPRNARARSAGLRVLWALRGEDLPLAADAFAPSSEASGAGEEGGSDKNESQDNGIDGPALASRTTLFVSVGSTAAAPANEFLSRLQALGARVSLGRIRAEDVLAGGERGRRKFYVCAPPGLVKEVQGWVGGEPVAVESFAY